MKLDLFFYPEKNEIKELLHLKIFVYILMRYTLTDGKNIANSVRNAELNINKG